jgi:hypothetical protein
MEPAPAFTRINFDIVQRSRGGNSLKTAAYIMCGRVDIGDDHYAFNRKASELVHGEVMLPPGSQECYRDTATLWSAAEAAERRVDAQTARQVLVSIPRECPRDLWPALARALVAPYVLDGMAAQVAIHCPYASDSEPQPHIHIQLSLRRMTQGGFATKKATEWNSQFREDQGRAERSRIAERASAFFREQGLDITLDPRSLADRGIDRAPEPAAPAADWKRWLRETGQPDAAPINVRAVLEHRQKRAVWERATASADAWQRHAEQLEAQAEALRKANAAKLKAALEDRARNNQKIIAVPAQHKVARAEAAKKEETTMAQRPQKTRTRSDSWMRGTSWDALSDRQREDARRAWERWTSETKRDRERYTLESYATYVMDARAREEAARVLDDEPAAVTDAPATQAAAQTNGIAPSSFSAAADSRRTHLETLLADRYQAPHALKAAGVKRVEVDRDGRRAVLHMAAGTIIDHGDRLTTEGATTPDLAKATIAAAAAKGWSSVRLTGSETYKQAVAMAALFHTPPLNTDHELSGEGRQTVQAQLRDRATLSVAPLDDLTGMAPADAAKARVNHEIRLAQALRSGEPQGERNPRTIAAARIAEVIARREQARLDAAEASAAAAQHCEAFGWRSRLPGTASYRRQSALDAEAAILDREARRLDRTHDKGVRRIERDAQREARQNNQVIQDWKWSRPVRQADAKLAQLAAIQSAVDAGDDSTIQAAANGKMGNAVKAAQDHQQAAALAAAQAEKDALAARTPQQLREAALTASLAAEKDAGRDPRHLEAARTVTAAIASGDPATIQAAASPTPNIQAAQRAAQEWKRREKERDEEIRLELEIQAAMRERQEMGAGLRL